MFNIYLPLSFLSHELTVCFCLWGCQQAFPCSFIPWSLLSCGTAEKIFPPADWNQNWLCIRKLPEICFLRFLLIPVAPSLWGPSPLCPGRKPPKPTSAVESSFSKKKFGKFLTQPDLILIQTLTDNLEKEDHASPWLWCTF